MSTQSFIPCERCKPSNGPQIGYYWSVSKGLGEKAFVVECECHIAWKKRGTLERKLHRANIHNTSLLDYIPIMSENINKLTHYVNNFEHNSFHSSLVYLYGGPQTLKTTTALWVGIELIKKNHTIKYISFSSLIKAITHLTSFDRPYPEELKEVPYASLFDSDLVIIDNAFESKAENLTSFQNTRLREFLQERIGFRQSGIILISRNSPFVLESIGYPLTICEFILARIKHRKSSIEFKEPIGNWEPTEKGIFDAD
jgi:DNA replication protein DnaC